MVKKRAAEPIRAPNGTFTCRGEPMEKARGVRLPSSVDRWVQKESSRRGTTVTDFMRQCIISQMEAMGESSE